MVRVDDERCAVGDREQQRIELARDDVRRECTGYPGIRHRDPDERMSSRLMKKHRCDGDEHHISGIGRVMGQQRDEERGRDHRTARDLSDEPPDGRCKETGVFRDGCTQHHDDQQTQRRE